MSANPVLRRRALKRLGARAPLRPFTRFLYVYGWRRGFLDGRAGLIFCMLRFAHDIHIVAKLAERRFQQRGEDASEAGRESRPQAAARFLSAAKAKRPAAEGGSGPA